MAKGDFKEERDLLNRVLIALGIIVSVPLLAFAALVDFLVYDARPYYFFGLGLIILLVLSILGYRLEKRRRLRKAKSKTDAIKDLEREELEAAKAWKRSHSSAPQGDN
jgi:uncharacterized membrane protein YqjE